LHGGEGGELGVVVIRSQWSAPIGTNFCPPFDRRQK